MSTTDNAAIAVSIIREYLTNEQTKELIGRLCDIEYNELLFAINEIVNPPAPPVPKWVKPTLYVLVAIHWVLVVAMILSFCLLPFLAEWFIAVPLMAFIVFFSTNRVTCKCTEFENYLRGKLGLKPIGGFVSHYFVRPIKNVYNKIIEFS